jgi:hypothetical protein
MKPIEQISTTQEEAMANRDRRLTMQGLCISCGKRPGTTGPKGGRLIYCPECRRANTEAQIRYKRRRAAGIAKKKTTFDIPDPEPEDEPQATHGTIRDRLAKRRERERECHD